jgi:hypothetical protein
MLAAAFSPLSTLRPLKMMPYEPSRAGRSAMANPKPWAPPVMIAVVVRFLKKKSSFIAR